MDIYVEGEEREGGFPLPDPRASRVKAFSWWYASLPLLITLKIRADDLGDCMSSAEVGILGGRISGEFQPQMMVLGCFGLSPYAA